MLIFFLNYCTSVMMSLQLCAYVTMATNGAWLLTWWVFSAAELDMRDGVNASVNLMNLLPKLLLFLEIL